MPQLKHKRIRLLESSEMPEKWVHHWLVNDMVYLIPLIYSEHKVEGNLKFCNWNCSILFVCGVKWQW
jgi:hypothetical protein